MSHRIYNEDAQWFEWLTVPEDYAGEAETYRQVLVEAVEGDLGDVLELGAGGGNNAFHLKRHFDLMLVDLSPRMLELSRRRNPECRHAQGDMRSVRLDRTFDAIFVHDAVAYMTTEEDLRAAAETAFVHCRAGGAALFVPKFLRETFTSVTRHGGRDLPDGRGGMRWLHWSHDPDPADTSYTVLLTCVFREEDGSYRVAAEEHENGLFSRDAWTGALTVAGFAAPEFRPLEGACMVIARRPEVSS